MRNLNNTVEILKKENASFKTKIKTCNDRINDLEQWSRIDNLEIQGISERPNENIYNVLENLGNAIGCPIPASDVSIAHRVQHFNNNSKQPRNIIVKLQSRRKIYDILAASRKYKISSPNTGRPGIRVNDLGESVFINEHLSNSNKLLFKCTRDAAKNLGYKFTWVRNCTIFVRKN